MSAPWGKEGVGSNADKSGQGVRGLAVSGHPFQCGHCKREAGISRSFYHLAVLKIEK